METSPTDIDLIAPLTMPLRQLTGDYTLRIDTPYAPMRRPTGPAPEGRQAPTLRALADDLAGALDGLRAGGDMTAWVPSSQTAGTGSHRP